MWRILLTRDFPDADLWPFGDKPMKFKDVYRVLWINRPKPPTISEIIIPPLTRRLKDVAFASPALVSAVLYPPTFTTPVGWRAWMLFVQAAAGTLWCFETTLTKIGGLLIKTRSQTLRKIFLLLRANFGLYILLSSIRCLGGKQAENLCLYLLMYAGATLPGQYNILISIPCSAHSHFAKSFFDTYHSTYYYGSSSSNVHQRYALSGKYNQHL